MSDKRPKDSPATLGDALKGLRWQEATLLFTLGGSVLTGYNVFVSKAKAEAIDAGLPTKLEVDALKGRVATVEQGQVLLRQDVRETQADIRALYKAVMTGQRQERLEQPPVDGGPTP